jgi:hypothetical protein
MDLSKSKSILAKLMATENLHIEEKKTDTASFDIESRILTIPILDRALTSCEYDLFVGHEVGHALYTPIDGIRSNVKSGRSHSVMNVLEDSRIERKIKSKYPGIRVSFYEAYKILFDKNFFGTVGKDVNSYNFIDRINLYCKVGVASGVVFNDKELELLHLVETTQTYDDVISVYEKVCEHLRESFNSGKNTDATEDGDSFPGASGEADGGEYTPIDINDLPQGSRVKITDDKDSDTETESTTSDEDSSGGSGSKPLDGDDIPIESETDKSFQENSGKLYSKENFTYVYANIPKFDMGGVVMDHRELWDLLGLCGYSKSDSKRFIKFREDSKRVVSYLIKEFELRKNADQMKRVTIAKTGDLNMSKIFSYKFNEDIFKKISVVPGGKSHGLVMFLDWSGSMIGNNLIGAIEQLLSLAMFCRKVNIPYEVYAFSSTGSKYVYIHQHKKDDLYVGEFKLFNILSGRMTPTEFNYAASTLMTIATTKNSVPSWFRLTGTPLNSAIIAAMDIIPAFKAKYKLQTVNTVFLTDGEGERTDTVASGVGNSRIKTAGVCRIVVRDKESKQEVEIADHHDNQKITSGLISLLKKKTGCNVIGFHIIGTFGCRSALTMFNVTDNKNEILNRFKRENYCVVTSGGYDEFYLLNSGIPDDLDEMEIPKTMSSRSIAASFNRFSKSKKSNRVVLTRFINLIT